MVVLIALAFFLHEVGHASMALVLGKQVTLFNVLGILWYPYLAWQPQMGFGGFVTLVGAPDLVQARLVLLAGSTFTLLIALAAALTLNLWAGRGYRRTALVAGSFYFLDSVIHLWPVAGLPLPPHNFRFVLSFSEAYYAAVDLGIPSALYISVVGMTSVTILLLLIRSARRMK